MTFSLPSPLSLLKLPSNSATEPGLEAGPKYETALRHQEITVTQ